MKDNIIQHFQEELRWALALIGWGLLELMAFVVLQGLSGAFGKGCAYTLGLLALLHLFTGSTNYWKYKKIDPSLTKASNLEVFLAKERQTIQQKRQIELIFFCFGLIWMLSSIILRLPSFSVGIGFAICISIGFSLIWWLMRQWRLAVLMGED